MRNTLRRRAQAGFALGMAVFAAARLAGATAFHLQVRQRQRAVRAVVAEAARDEIFHRPCDTRARAHVRARASGCALAVT